VNSRRAGPFVSGRRRRRPEFYYEFKASAAAAANERASNKNLTQDDPAACSLTRFFRGAHPAPTMDSSAHTHAHIHTLLRKLNLSNCRALITVSAHIQQRITTASLSPSNKVTNYSTLTFARAHTFIMFVITAGCCYGRKRQQPRGRVHILKFKLFVLARNRGNIKNKTANKITPGKKLEGLARSRRHSQCAPAKTRSHSPTLREADESGERMPCRCVLRETGIIVLNLFNHCIKISLKRTCVLRATMHFCIE
jgi:hypothetical protein